ncbi:MAG: hypothetical protein IT319_15580 [Anaerolineae bacterium]|nr:hypothetical protein [Anaerolineae bacterium]
MRALRTFGRVFKNFMIVFSFVVNVVLVLVVLALVLFIFDIKNNVVTPLVAGLHSSFVGLDEATIDWTIPVRDTIPVKFDLPLNQSTIVTLTESVPLSVGATIVLPGIGQLNNAQVYLNLPAGLELPVQLDLNVPVDQQIDVAMDVRAVIPLSETQLHDPFDNLRLIFEPLARALYNLPDNFGEAGQMVGDIVSGRGVNLLAENDYSRDPWFGFSQTAGLRYPYAHEPVEPENRPVETGLVMRGGIPSLDEALRPDVYAQGGPAAVNDRALANLPPDIPGYNYDGSYGDYTASDIDYGVSAAPDDLGILPTPAPGG